MEASPQFLWKHMDSSGIRLESNIAGNNKTSLNIRAAFLKKKKNKKEKYKKSNF